MLYTEIKKLYTEALELARTELSKAKPEDIRAWQSKVDELEKRIAVMEGREVGTEPQIPAVGASVEETLQ